MRRTLAMVVLIAANFMDLLDTTVVNVALPDLGADLKASAAQLEWVVAAYTLGLAATLVLGGRLGDRLGRRTVFVSGVVGFTLASLLCAVAPSACIIVAARAAQGAFAGAMVPQVLAAVQELYEPDRRGPIFGLVGFITGSASVAGPVLGGWLLDADPFGIGWRGVFAINVPVGILLAIVALIVVPSKPIGTRGRGDIVGIALTTVAAVVIMVALVDGRQAGWPVWVWISLAVGTLCVAGLCAREASVGRRWSGGKGEVEPFLPLDLFRNRGYVGGALANFLYQAGLVAFFLYLALHLQSGLGFSPMAAGLTWLGFSVGTLVSSVLTSTPVATRHRSAVMTGGALLTAVGFGWAALVAGGPGGDAIRDGWPFAPPLAVAGLGLGGLIVPLFGATLEAVPQRDAGAASGALSMLQQLGGAIGVAVVGIAFYARADSSQGFLNAALVSAALFLAAAAAVVGLTSDTTMHPAARERTSPSWRCP